MDFGSGKREQCLNVLGLPSGASEDEIKKAYRSNALMYHPDKNPSPDAKMKFQEISAAYNYLMEGDDYLRRLQEEDINLFFLEFENAICHEDFIFNNLFSKIFGPIFGGQGASGRNQFYYYDDDDDDDFFDYQSYHYVPQYTYQPSSQPTSFQGTYFTTSTQRSRYSFGNRPTSPPSASTPSHQGSGYPFGNRPTSPPSASTPPHHYSFTHANSQHGQYFHETKQNGKSAKKINKEARMARKESAVRDDSSASNSKNSNAQKQSYQSQRCATSSFESNERCATGSFEKSASCSTHPWEPSEKDAKEASPSSSESVKPEHQSAKKSKRQLRNEQKQKKQELSEIRQQLEEEETRKKKKSEERRIAQEQKNKAEREAREEERKTEEERLKVEKEAIAKQREEVKRKKLKEQAEFKKRRQLLEDFDSNQFLGENGDFQANDPNLFNIIKMDSDSELLKEEDPKVENINGIPVADLARLQNLNLNGNSDATGKQKSQENGSNSTPTGKRRKHRSRRHNSENMSNTNDCMKNGVSPKPNIQGIHYSNIHSQQVNQQKQRQYKPIQQYGQHIYQAYTPSMQQYIVVPVAPGPMIAPRLPPPQLNRPPPLLPFNVRPCGPRQANLNHPSPVYYSSQLHRMNAI